jgi:hypothetical protein
VTDNLTRILLAETRAGWYCADRRIHGKKPIPVETIADNTMIDKLVRKGFIYQFYKNR